MFQRLFERIFLAIFLLLLITAARAQAPSAPGKPLPPGPMQAKVKSACSSCHNVSRITEQHLTRQEWSGELKKMEGLGAVVSDSDRNGMLNYLSKHFGSQKVAVKKPSSAAN